MIEKVAREVKYKALDMDAQRIPQKDIAHELGISVSLITKTKAKMIKHGDIEGGKKKSGPKEKMDPGMQEVFISLLDYSADKVLLSMVLCRPDAYLNEYAEALHSQFGLEISISAISKFFSRHDISRKKVASS